MKTILHKRLFAASLAAMGTSLPIPAVAQSMGEAPGILEEVIVTARRREEVSQDVPIAITAMSGEFVRDNNIDKFEDIQYYAPGLKVMQSGQSDQNPVIALRGQRATEALIHLEPAVPLYFNEVVVAPLDGANAALYDLENVQVLKGPQGTLFGRNSTGGAVLFTPTRPGEEFGGYVQLGVGNYDLIKTEFGMDVPLFDRFRARISGKTVDRDGYVDNLWSDKGGVDKFWDEKSRSLRLSLVADITDALENYTVVSWDDSDPAGRNPSVRAVNPEHPLGMFVIAAAKAGVITDQVALDDPSKAESELPDFFDKVEAWFASNTTTWDVGDLTVKNIFGYRDVRHETTVDTDGTGLPLIYTPVDTPTTVDGDAFSDELQLQGESFDDRLTWIAGAYYYEMDARQTFYTSTALGLDVDDADILNKSSALFVQGTYDIFDQWAVTLGARNSWDDRAIGVINSRDGSCTNKDNNGSLLPDNNCKLKNSKNWSAPTWLATVTYSFSDAAMAYASVSTGYRSGGFNLRATSPLELQPFDEENVTNYELGLKADWELGGTQVRSNLAIYHQDYQDIQRTTAIPDESGASNIIAITANAAEATIEGLDLELTVVPVEGLNISVNYAYVDTEYDKYLDTTTIGLNGEPRDLSGTKFLWIPDHQLTATVRYTLPIDPSIGEIALQANVYYQSELTRQTSFPNVPKEVEDTVLEQDSYSVQNYQVDWLSIMESNFNMSLWLKNATDEEYVVGGLTVLSQLGEALYNYGAPRTYGVTVTYNF